MGFRHLTDPLHSNLVLLCRGCGMLSRLTLDCPALHSLDATFCGRLGGPALELALANCPPLRSLVLSVCSNLDAFALTALMSLPHLTLLDLSYTEVKVGTLWRSTTCGCWIRPYHVASCFFSAAISLFTYGRWTCAWLPWFFISAAHCVSFWWHTLLSGMFICCSCHEAIQRVAMPYCMWCP